MRQLPPLVDGRGVYDLLLNRGKKSVALDLQEPDGARVARSPDRARGRRHRELPSAHGAAPRRVGRSGSRAASARDSLRDHRLRPDRAVRRAARARSELRVGVGAARGRPAGSDRAAAHVHRGHRRRRDERGHRHSRRARRPRARRRGPLARHLDARRRAVLGDAAGRARAGRRRRDAIGELPTFGRHACYNVYRTKDGQLIALGALEPKFWLAFCEAVGRPDLTPRHLTRSADQTRLLAEVRELFATRTRDEWLAHFRGHDVCLTPVNSPAEALRRSARHRARRRARSPRSRRFAAVRQAQSELAARAALGSTRAKCSQDLGGGSGLPAGRASHAVLRESLHSEPVTDMVRLGSRQ